MFLSKPFITSACSRNKSTLAARQSPLATYATQVLAPKTKGCQVDPTDRLPLVFCYACTGAIGSAPVVSNTLVQSHLWLTSSRERFSGNSSAVSGIQDGAIAKQLFTLDRSPSDSAVVSGGSADSGCPDLTPQSYLELVKVTESKLR